jgi:hypothetical protein
MINKKLAFLIYFLLGAFVVFSGYIFYYFFYKNIGKETKFSNEFLTEELNKNKNISLKRDVLVKENQFWSNADKLRNEGSNELAILEYEKAIGIAGTAEEQGIIKISLGRLYYKLGKFDLGSTTFKSVVENPDYSNVTRAYAVEAMGNEYYSKYEQELFDSIFKDEPYRSFLVGKDKELSMRKLFEYGTTFYPLPLSEARIAQWYASELVRIKVSGLDDQETKTKIESMKTIIREKLKLVDKGIKDIENTTNAPRIPVVLNRLGIISMKMYLFGDKSFGNPADLFERSLVYSKLYNLTSTEGFTYYNYAVFLARVYGKEKTSEISTLLGNFYNTDKYKNTDVFIFLKNQKNIEGTVKEDILLLASFDSKFKKLLSELGWGF